MDVVYQLPAAYITEASTYKEEFLTVSEARDAVKKGFLKSKDLNMYSKNRGTIPMYLGDDPANLRRPIYINFKGYSNYGISKFQKKKGDLEPREEQKKKKKKDREDSEEKEETEEKKKKESWSIGFGLDDNPHLVELCADIDALVKKKVKAVETKIYEHFKMDPTETPLTYRKTGRSSSGSSIKTMRLTVRPGRCELGPSENLDIFKSLEFFPQNTPGLYQVVVHFDHVDISYEKEIISVGPILYASIVRQNPVPKNTKRKFREDTDSLNQTDGTKSAKPTETD